MLNEPHVAPPTQVQGLPSVLREAVVQTVNSDGTMDLKAVDSRSGWTRVVPPGWYAPTVGDRVVLADLQGDGQQVAMLTTFAATGTKAVPIGAAGGDLTGSYPNPALAVDRLRGMTLVAATSKVSVGNGNVAWTTIDVSAQVPAGAKIAVLRIAVGGITASAAFLQNSIDVRMDSSSQIAATVAWKAASNGTIIVGGGVTETVLVPLSGTRTFQYQKTDAIGNSSGGSIDILGYLT